MFLVRTVTRSLGDLSAGGAVPFKMNGPIPWIIFITPLIFSQERGNPGG